eukprot:366161-Chlamydomonas_euryale.AAC.4
MQRTSTSNPAKAGAAARLATSRDLSAAISLSRVINSRCERPCGSAHSQQELDSRQPWSTACACPHMPTHGKGGTRGLLTGKMPNTSTAHREKAKHEHTPMQL